LPHPLPRITKQRTLLAVAAFAVIATWSCGGNGGGHGDGFSAQYLLSVSRLKAANTGLILYINDYDDAVPLSNKWVDELTPYVKDPTSFNSPAVAAPGYGYALNSAVAGKDLISFTDPSTTISLFDSTDLARNATDPTSTEPSPPRYGKRNTLAYLDGHVQDEVTTQTPPPSLYVDSQTRLKSVNLGMFEYANDWDDVEPLANKWMDGLQPYVKNDALFHSPAIVI